MASDYTIHRVKWDAYTLFEKAEHDGPRSTAHDAFLDHTRIIARHASERELRLPAFKSLRTDRKTWGDLACVATALVGMRNSKTS